MVIIAFILLAHARGTMVEKFPADSSPMDTDSSSPFEDSSWESNCKANEDILASMFRSGVLQAEGLHAFPMDGRQLTSKGVFEFVGPSVHTSFDSKIFFARKEGIREANFVVKYMHDCGVLMDPRSGLTFENAYVPLVHDFAFSYLLSRSGVVPRLVWKSELTPLPLQSGIFEMSVEETEDCLASGALFRTLVEERAGLTLEDHFANLMLALEFRPDSPSRRTAEEAYLREVIWATSEALKLLEVAHSGGIVHGDFHGRNIAFRGPGKRALVLIDLGMAALVCSESVRSETPERISVGIRTPWQLEEQGVKGFRDDVFRVLETMANWLSFGAWDESVQRIIADPQIPRAEKKVLMRQFKMRAKLFGRGVNYDAFHVLKNIDPETIRFVREVMDDIMMYVRIIPSADTPVEFEYLQEQLGEISERVGA